MLKTVADKSGVIVDDLTKATDAGVQFERDLETVILVGVGDLGRVAGESKRGRDRNRHGEQG